MKKALLFAGFCAIAIAVSAQNPFAYGISADGVNVSYTLNADASKVFINLMNGDVLVKAFEAPEGSQTKGSHEVAVDIDDLQPGNYSFQITVQGLPNQEIKEIFTDTGSGQPHQFWSPYGLAVDNNPNSPHFGRVLVTETQANMGATYFAGKNVGAGIYEYDPQGNPVESAEGLYGYNPLKFTNFKYVGGAASTAFHAKKVRITKDGRIFVGVLNTIDNPIYEVNPDDLNAWSPVFDGTINTEGGEGYVYTADQEFLAAPSAAFDVWGEGDDLKFANLGCQYGQNYALGSYTCYEYNLGKNKTISAAPASEDRVTPYTYQYSISSQSVSIAYDADGKGIWYVQYRSTPTEAQPSIKHATINEDGDWEEDYSDITTIARGGGVAWNKDYTMLAMPKNSNVLGVYTVAKENGAPVLTEKYSINTAIRGFNDIAFDYANNIYVCDNGKEYMQLIQLPDSPNGTVVTTPAPMGQEIIITPTAVNDINAKTVSSVQYVNINGQVSNEPFTGINVVVTNYSDGSKTVAKIVK